MLKAILKAPKYDITPTDLPMKPLDNEAELIIHSMSDSSLEQESSDQEEEEVDIFSDDEEYHGQAIFFDEEESAAVEPLINEKSQDEIDMNNLQRNLDSFPGNKDLAETVLNYKRGSDAIRHATRIPAPILQESVSRSRRASEKKSEDILVQELKSPPVFMYFGQPNTISSPSILPTPIEDDSSDDEEDNIPIMQLLSPNVGESPRGARLQMPSEPKVDLTQIVLSKLSNDNIRKSNLKIYIENSKRHITMTFTSLMPAEQILNEITSTLQPDPSWALFELNINLGIERPIRPWEIVTDVISAWSLSQSNALIVKKSPHLNLFSNVYLLVNSSFLVAHIPVLKGISI
jgi:hypothetical protein